MANAVEKANTIAITDIQAINGITDDNLQALNGLEFTGVIPDSLVLLATATASSSSTLAFASGIDSTYDIYEFHFLNMHPSNDGVNLQFQVNAVGASGFNETITSTGVNAHFNEDGTGENLSYNAGMGQAQGTGYQYIGGRGTGSDADQSASGILTLYAPSSTTYVKQFTSNGNTGHVDNYTLQGLTAGYINTTAAIDEISFKFSAGNIDAGKIKMYGIIK